jgi:hypothetical protein
MLTSPGETRVIKGLTEKYFPSYGVPVSIVSDNASVFKSYEFSFEVYVVFIRTS